MCTKHKKYIEIFYPEEENFPEKDNKIFNLESKKRFNMNSLLGGTN